MKNIALIIAFYFLSCNLSASNSDTLANETVPKPVMEGVVASVMYGWQLLDIASLNQALRSHGYPEFTGQSITFGASLYRTFGRLVFGGEGQLLFVKEISNDDINGSLSSGYGFMNFGYRINNHSKCNLFPVIGIGGGNSKLKLVEKDQDLSFGDILSNPNRAVEISTGNVLVNAAINLEYYYRGMETSGFHYGITLGYMHDLSGNGWYMQNNRIQGGPYLSLAGPYVKLKFGGGGFSVK
jgi:hypothetical protein